MEPIFPNVIVIARRNWNFYVETTQIYKLYALWITKIIIRDIRYFYMTL